MSNYIAENRDWLKSRHYIRQARLSDFWFDFSRDKLFQKYKGKYNLDFCLVLFAPGDTDNAYVLPYQEFSAFFEEDQLDPTRDRWTGEIKNNIMRLRPSNRAVSVSQYFNAFNLLDISKDQELRKIRESEVFYNVKETIDINSLKRLIMSYNEQYQDIAPDKRQVISEQVSRPGAITDYLKQLNNYTCQICREKGFEQTNGVPYIEAHHITELHKLIPSSYCSDNIIVICANCHRKLHYARVILQAIDNNRVSVQVNGQLFEFQRNIVSD